MSDSTSEHDPGSTAPVGWQRLLLDEVADLALRRPWGRAIRTIGIVHLTYFSVAQVLHRYEVYAAWVLLSLWTVELATVVLTMRLVAGKGWLYEAPAVGLIFRVWVTFLILSFNTVMLNGMLGFDHESDFFKVIWCTLASFGFATMAWLFGLRYLIPAFQMYFTGLFIFAFPAWGYLIHGASWFLVLQLIGIDMDRRRARIEAAGGPKGSDRPDPPPTSAS